jgi:signal transduction histidine kinase
VTIAVTSLIIVSFVVPLGILARRQAADRALSVAERSAQSIATALAVTSSFTGSEIDGATATAVLDAFGAPPGAGIFLSNGSVVGVGSVDDPDVDIARLGSAFTVRTGTGAAVLVPVLSGTTTTVVRVEVSTEELTEGVASAWLVLALLAALLVTIAIAAADRLGRSIVTPVADLGDAAAQLADGNLGTRVVPSGPPEIVEVGRAFNDLADRLGALLQAEREAAADLSHGLRTPLTALRLQVESLPAGSARDGLIEDVTLVEAAVDRVILEARTRTSDAPRLSDLAAAARDRSEFWEPLAVEQARSYTTDITVSPVMVHAARDEVITVLDTLIENVFAHTEPGHPIRISVSSDRVLRIEDGGPGFGLGAAARGHSDAGSTGLGLDIVGRIAQRSGGELLVETSSLGGAAVVVTFGAAGD